MFDLITDDDDPLSIETASSTCSSLQKGKKKYLIWNGGFSMPKSEELKSHSTIISIVRSSLLRLNIG